MKPSRELERRPSEHRSKPASSESTLYRFRGLLDILYVIKATRLWPVIFKHMTDTKCV